MFLVNAAAAGICTAMNKRGSSSKAPRGEKVSETTIPQEIAWRIFTKGIDRESACSQVKITGDVKLGQHVLG